MDSLIVFDRFLTDDAGIWRHADFIVKNPKTQGLIILGRR